MLFRPGADLPDGGPCNLAAELDAALERVRAVSGGGRLTHALRRNPRLAPHLAHVVHLEVTRARRSPAASAPANIATGWRRTKLRQLSVSETLARSALTDCSISWRARSIPARMASASLGCSGIHRLLHNHRAAASAGWTGFDKPGQGEPATAPAPCFSGSEPFTVAAELLGHAGKLDALAPHPAHAGQRQGPAGTQVQRSEERRVGKECR